MSDIGRCTIELLNITNAVPPDMPSPLGTLPDPGKNWDSARHCIIDSTREFKEFPLAKIAAEKIGAAKGWRWRQAVEFAREASGVIRFIAHCDREWGGEVEPPHWNFRLDEMYETRIEPRFKPDRVLVRENPLVPMYSKLKEWLRQLEPSRLRACPVCERVFYATRRDQSACSPVCSHRVRSRKWYATRGKSQRSEQEARS